MSLSIAQYGRFVTIGSLVAVLSIVSRELVGLLLGAETVRTYSLSVIAAYVVGILASFFLNSRFTFSGRRAGAPDWSRFPRFVAVALTGLLCTWGFSVTLRFMLPLEDAVGRYASTVAFALGTVGASLVTYPLNALLVFRRPVASSPRSASLRAS